MSGETDLRTLLRGLAPRLSDEVYVLVTLPPGAPVPPALKPVGRFSEAEGETLIVARDAAAYHGLGGTFASRMITLGVHSDPAAVGLLATVTRVLADAGIAVNAISAFHHDHLLVPEARAPEALALLEGLGGTLGQ